MNKFASISCGLMLLVVPTFISAPVMAQGGSCLGAAQIQSAVAAGEILSLAQVLQIGSPGSTPLPVPPVKVCGRGGDLYYEVAVRTPSGEATILSLNARTGRQ